MVKLEWLYDKLLYIRMYMLWSAVIVDFDDELVKKYSNLKLCDYVVKSKKDIYTFSPIITRKSFYHIHLSNERIWLLLKGIIFSKYPTYIETEEWMRRSRKFSGCNMFIMRKELFYDYSKWLFDILGEFEREIV